jgi:DNA-binding transcriptional MerR regulator
MTYSLAQIVRRSGVSVDTVRYYQSHGLLHRPKHKGRNAFYDDSHIERLRLIRSLSKRGFSLKVIAAFVSNSVKLDSDDALREAVEEAAEPRYSSAEMARQLGIPRSLLGLVERCGLAESLEQENGAVCYSEADLRVARAGAKLLDHKFPVAKLLALAIKHDRAARKTADEAIDLFNEYVRKRGSALGGEDVEAVAGVFRELLPTVTSLVAHHFQRLLIGRALQRLKRNGESEAFEVARKTLSELRLRPRLS